MPDINDDNVSIQDRLADLGNSFNTNPSFGLMGMIEAQETGQGTPAPASAPAAPAADDKPPEWFALINDSLQSVKDSTQQGINQLTREVSSLKQAVPAGQPAPSYDDGLDPDLRQVRSEVAQVRLNAAYDRARNALAVAKAKHPDFDYTEDELQRTWQEHIGTNVGAAEATNFDMYFQQQYDSRQRPKIEQENARLKAELEALKGSGNMSAMSSVPRPGRQTSASSPSASSGSDFDEDIYRRASAKMSKGKFMGFNRALIEEQNRKLLTRAS